MRRLRWCTRCGMLWAPDLDPNPAARGTIAFYRRPACECPGDFAQFFPRRMTAAIWAAKQIGGDAAVHAFERELFEVLVRGRGRGALTSG